IAGAAAHGREPGVAGAAAQGAQRRGIGAFEVGPIDIALEAEDGAADLPIIAGGAADEAAGQPDAIRVRIPIGMAPAAAAVDAEIEAAPVIGRRHRWRWRLVERGN